jgi:hypothetical protein
MFEEVVRVGPVERVYPTGGIGKRGLEPRTQNAWPVWSEQGRPPIGCEKRDGEVDLMTNLPACVMEDELESGRNLSRQDRRGS